MKQILPLLTLAVLTGCMSPPQRELEKLQELPGTYSRQLQDATLSKQTGTWWLSFGREDLNDLQQLALNDNLNLAQAWARLRQSEAAALQAGAKLYPGATLNSGYERRWQESNQRGTSDYSVGLGVSYELDLWGKIRAERNAAEVQAQVSAENLESTALTLSTAVAERWIEVIEAQKRIELLEAQLETNITQLELVELRFQTAKASSLDVYQQRQTIARTRSQLPSAEADLALSKHALNLLLGRASSVPVDIERQIMPELPPSPATGVPSDLLSQRPDVRAALLEIELADWNISQAKADRLPSISLSANSSTGAERFEDLFDNWLANLAGNLSAPLLDGGRRQQEVLKQQASLDESLAAFRETVLNAFKEVEDALVNQRRARLQLEATRAELELARQTLTEARNRYANGLSDYLNVTTALVSVQGLERDEITQVVNQFKARINLHKALGGNLPSY